MPKILIGISILLMTLSLLFGFLNTNKVKSLRSELVTTTSARDLAERSRVESERKAKVREADLAAAKQRAEAAEGNAKAAAADLSKAQTEKAQLEAKLQASAGEIADLQKRMADASGGASPGSSPNDLKAMLDETRHQLETAEAEKSILADKVRAAQERVASLEKQQKRRRSAASSAGVHGRVLAVNQAYNFVVLSVGARQGVEPNSEMLVLRDGSFIGKVRISSVEPTTSIGDIISNSLARGVEVLPGDTVVYAGNNHS